MLCRTQHNVASCVRTMYTHIIRGVVCGLMFQDAAVYMSTLDKYAQEDLKENAR